MAQEFLPELGLLSAAAAAAGMLNLMLVWQRPGPLLRLLLCAWPLSAMIGIGLAVGLLPLGPEPSLLGVMGLLSEMLGGLVGATALGLAGALATPGDRGKGAGAGIAAMGALALAYGFIPVSAGDAADVAMFSSIVSGVVFFFRDWLISNSRRKPASVLGDVEPEKHHLRPAQGKVEMARPASADAEATDWGSSISGPGPATASAPRIIRVARTPSAQPPLLEEAPYPSPSWARHALVGAAGAAAMAALVIVAGGMAGERVLSAMLLYPFKWFPVPMLIGAAGGASVSLLIKGKLL